MDRRKFLTSSARQIAAMNVLGISSATVIASSSERRTIGNQEKMIRRTLGRTGISLPVVSMGVMNANNPGLVRGAWEAGIRMFDTAWVYQNGNNEKMVGSVLRELNVNRSEAIIATKILLPSPLPPRGKERKKMFLQRFEESLSRLQMDYVDILYYHDMQSVEQINDRYILDAFTELKAKKKIRFTGFSTHVDWPDQLTDAAKRKFYDVVLLSYHYGLSNDTRVAEAIRIAHEAGIGLVAMKTQCQQGWYKQDLPVEQQKYFEGTLMNAALLKWALNNEYITTAVPGFTTFPQLNEDVAVAYNLSFTEEEEKFLKSREVRMAIRSVCRQCRHCVNSCPQKADIPSLMRTHMYSISYGNLLMAKQTLSSIQSGKGLDVCKNCNSCTGKCQFSVPIANRIRDLKEIYC